MRLPRPARAILLAPYLAVFYPLLALRRAIAALRPAHAWRTWIDDRILLVRLLALLLHEPAHLHGHDLVVEVAQLLAARGALLAAQRVLVLVLA